MGVGAGPTGTRALGARQVRIDAQGGVDRAVAGVGCLVLAPRRPAPLSACASSPRARAFRHHHVEIVHLSSVIPPPPRGQAVTSRRSVHGHTWVVLIGSEGVDARREHRSLSCLPVIIGHSWQQVRAAGCPSPRGSANGATARVARARGLGCGRGGIRVGHSIHSRAAAVRCDLSCLVSHRAELATGFDFGCRLKSRGSVVESKEEVPRDLLPG